MRRLARPLAAALVAVAALAAAPAAGGPWPRGAGEGFLSFTVEPGARHGKRPNRVQLYGEYGLRPRLTVAASIERHATGRRQEAALRWHPPDLPGGIVWGLSAGMRRATGAGMPAGEERRAMLNLSLGRGFDTALGNIWARSDVTAVIGRAPGGALARDLELAAQIGLRHEGWIGMVGITRDRDRYGTHTRLRPALGYEITPRLTLTGEATLAPGGRHEGLALSLWARF